ncbi:MAG: hypothetical protein NTX52_13795, partial [Planctomycetota bacterium]|nr:hypothetical protein [Planctomycetota bacterium]
MAKLRSLMAPSENTVLEVIDLAYADAEILAETLQKVFSSKESKDNLKNVQKVEKSPEHSGPQMVASEAESTGALLTPRAYVEVYSVGRTNQLIIKALIGDIEKLRKLVEKLDSYVEPTTKSYHFTYVDASEIYTGLERILDVSGRYGSYSSPEGRSRQQGSIRGGITLIEKSNSVLVTGPPSVHRIMASIIESIDVPATYEAGIIRVYKLENADVDEVASAIRELLQSQDKQKPKSGEVKFSEEPPSGGPKPQSSGDLTKTEEFIPEIVARVAVSKATNSVIVQATARQHRELEKLIKELDKRRKQVLIEAMIVEVVTTDSLDLGVELNHANGSVLAFSSFGLSKIDP